MMSQHPFDSDFRITPEQKVRFQRDGFVKLDGFLNANVIAALLDRVEVEMGRSTLDNLKANSLVNRNRVRFRERPESNLRTTGTALLSACPDRSGRTRSLLHI